MEMEKILMSVEIFFSLHFCMEVCSLKPISGVRKVYELLMNHFCNIICVEAFQGYINYQTEFLMSENENWWIGYRRWKYQNWYGWLQGLPKYWIKLKSVWRWKSRYFNYLNFPATFIQKLKNVKILILLILHYSREISRNK